MALTVALFLSWCDLLVFGFLEDDILLSDSFMCLGSYRVLTFVLSWYELFDRQLVIGDCQSYLSLYLLGIGCLFIQDNFVLQVNFANVIG